MGTLSGVLGAIDVAIVSGGSGGSDPAAVAAGSAAASAAYVSAIGVASASGNLEPVTTANPVPVLDAYTSPSANTWTSGTAVNTAATVATAGYDTVIVTLVANSSFAGGVVVFEAYDGAAWIPIKSSSISDYTTTGATVTPTASSSKGYQVPVAGFPQFRVRLSTALSAGSLVVTTITSSAPDVSVVTVGLDPAQALPAGTNAIGAVYPSTTNASGGQPSMARIAGNASAAYGLIRSGSGRLYGYHLMNTTASTRYVHFYAKATQPTLGTDTPLYTVPIPAGAVTSMICDTALGYFSTGIEYQITTDDNTIPTTAGSAGDVVGTVLYA